MSSFQRLAAHQENNSNHQFINQTPRLLNTAENQRGRSLPPCQLEMIGAHMYGQPSYRCSINEITIKLCFWSWRHIQTPDIWKTVNELLSAATQFGRLLICWSSALWCTFLHHESRLCAFKTHTHKCIFVLRVIFSEQAWLQGCLPAWGCGRS